MAAGNIKIQANDTRIYTLTPEDGAGSNVELTIPKDGGKLATNVYQSIAASRMLAGDVSVTNTITTQGMNTTLYTGNGSTQSVVTGIDMDTQWGNDASERFGGLVWGKSRSSALDNLFIDTVRGYNSQVSSNTTGAATASTTNLTAFTSNGFTLGNALTLNTNLATYASWNFQTTHRKSGTTNHGQPYECHYNPFTGFTIVKYTGSGLAGHEIPHHLGRKLGLAITKNLSITNDWLVNGLDNTLGLALNTTAINTSSIYGTRFNDSVNTLLSGSPLFNTSGNTYITYGWANSFYDDKGVLNGNYEVGTYVGTGAAGNKVTTRGKPAWVMIKRLDSTGNWLIFDNKRTYYQALKANASDAEVNWATNILASDGFIVDGSNTDWNASGGTYLYMVVYDTNANGGGTYYPRATDTSNLQLTDAQLMYSDGYANGTAKNTSEVLSGMTYPSVTYTAGYNYVKKTSGGGYSATPYEPKFGDADGFSDCYINGKWYNNIAVFKDDFSDGNTDGWTNGTFVTGTIKIINASHAYQNITLQANKKYRIRFKHKSSNGAYPQVYVNDGTWSSIGVALVSYNTYSLGTISITKFAEAYADFKTVSTSAVIRLASDSTGDTFSYFDDISIVPINDDGSIDTSSATPLGNITYLPIKVLADASGQIVSAENWKYPEVVVDMIKAREYEGLPIASPTKEGISKTSLLAEYTVTGSACTSIDFSGLDINTHKSYRVEIELTNATASATALYCFVNGDTTITNYWSQVAGGSNATYSGARNNSPIVLDLIASSRGFSCIFITKPSSYPAITGTYVKLDTSSISEYLVGAQKTATVTNITQLTFTATVASAIGVGSKIRIYRGDV